jgi:hypothetical protein
MADPIRFLRLTALPTVFLTDALYFIQTGPDTFDLYVTGNDATPHQLGRGPAGEPGPSWSTISGGGTISGGNPGDFCLHTDTGDLEENLDGAWTVIGNLKGPAGAPGAPGVAGTSVVAAVALGGHRAITVFGQYAEPGDENVLAGITTGAVNMGDTAYAIRDGIIVEPSWSWTPGLPIFIASGGILTQSPPTSAKIRRVAWAMSSTTINVDFYPAIELI